MDNLLINQRGLLKIISQFRRDMQKVGVLVGKPIFDNFWKSPNIRYDVLTGLKKYDPSSILKWSFADKKSHKLNGEFNFISDEGATCYVDFRIDSVNEYELRLPGEIVKGARSLTGLIEGAR